MQADLDLGTSETAWVLTAFALAFAVTTPVFGRVADSVGPRVPFVLGVVLLGIGAAVSSLAGDLPTMLVGRIVQGAGAGAVPVLTSAVLAARFTGQDRATALGRANSVLVVSSSTGPLLGGALGVLVGWRAPFALPLLALLLLPAVLRLAPHGGTGERVDVTGAALVGGSAAALITLVQTAGRPSPVTAGAAALLVPLLVLLTRHVRRRPDGFLPLRVVTDGVIVRSAVAAAGMPMAYFGSLLAVPLLLTARGWNPLQTGLLLLPGAAVGAVVSFSSARVLARTGRRPAAAAGLALSVVGVALSAAADVSPLLAAVGFAFLTTGFSLAQPALVGAVTAAVPAELRGAALGTFSLVFFVGAGLGSGVVGALGDRVGLGWALAVAGAGTVAGAVTLLTGRGLPAWSA